MKFTPVMPVLVHPKEPIEKTKNRNALFRIEQLKKDLKGARATFKEPGHKSFDVMFYNTLTNIVGELTRIEHELA